MPDSKRDTDVKNRLLDSSLYRLWVGIWLPLSDRALGQSCASPLRQALGQGCASPQDRALGQDSTFPLRQTLGQDSASSLG